MEGIDVERHKKCMRMGIHFYVSSMKGDQKTAEKLIDEVKKMDENDAYAFLMGVYLTASTFSQILADQIGMSRDDLVKKTIKTLNEDDILDSVKFGAD